MRAVSASSRPKPLTTRTPVTVSSTCSAIVAAWACVARFAGTRRTRLRAAVKASAGTTVRVTRVTRVTRASGGDSHSMATTETANWALTPIGMGSMPSTIWICCRLLLARETT